MFSALPDSSEVLIRSFIPHTPDVRKKNQDKIGKRACLLEVGAVRVDHDAVGVPVDHLQPQLVFGEVYGSLEALSPLSRHQGRDGLGVETAVVAKKRGGRGVGRGGEREQSLNRKTKTSQEKGGKKKKRRRNTTGDDLGPEQRI